MNQRIVILGAGKVGQALVNAMLGTGHALEWYNRSPRQEAMQLAAQYDIPYWSDLKTISKDADLYLLAVADKAIEPVAADLSTLLSSDRLVVHTSGATDAAVLAPYFARYGVFYPLQTFSEERTLNFRAIPICIEAAKEEDLGFLFELGGQISDQVQELSSAQRRWLHVAAVLVNNFVNQLYTEAYDLLDNQGIPFSLLLPLIRETSERLSPDQNPAHWQTGPAMRADTPTLEAHLALIKDDPSLQEVYRLLSQRIQFKKGHE
jgi:predicted short-subunit dehydrogenase-like oxidoreductase (DUF2520 family)